MRAVVNVESTLVALFNADETIQSLGLKAHTSVPNPRPDRFITVERTGGPVGRFQDKPTVAIQTWAQSRYEGSELSRQVADVLLTFRYQPHVFLVNIQSNYNNPDPDSGQARYQIVADLVTQEN
jgi:hypothetical protein